MKKRYLLIGVLLVSSCMLIFTVFNKKSVDRINDVTMNEEVEEAEEVNGKKVDKVEEIVELGYEELESFLEDEAANKRFQGVALVAEGDKIVFAKAYGQAEGNRENKLTTRFAIASNTKQFTATAIMQLVEENKISLDETIDKYFPEYKYGSSITIKNLLQMRSGIPDYLNEIELFMKDEDTKKMLKEYESNAYFDKYVEDKRWSPEIILKNLYLTDIGFAPNESYDYSNTNYYLLGLIIEEASGLSFEDYLKEYIFKPAKMKTSSMKVGNSDAQGHGSSESGRIVANPKFTYAAGGIYANVFDMFRWNRMLHAGDIISEQSYNEMITPVDGYGYGIFINENIIRHSGVIDGFNSNMEYDTGKDRTIIVLENAGPDTEILDAQYHTDLIKSYLD